MASNCCPFFKPPTKVHWTPSRLASRWTVSIRFELLSPASHISLSMQLFSQQMPSNTNPLDSLFWSQSRDESTHKTLERKHNYTLRRLPAMIRNNLNGALPVRMLHANETSHEPSYLLSCCAKLDKPKEVHGAHTEHSMKVLIRREVLEKLLVVVQIPLAWHGRSKFLQVQTKT